MITPWEHTGCCAATQTTESVPALAHFQSEDPGRPCCASLAQQARHGARPGQPHSPIPHSSCVNSAVSLRPPWVTITPLGLPVDPAASIAREYNTNGPRLCMGRVYASWASKIEHIRHVGQARSLPKTAATAAAVLLHQAGLQAAAVTSCNKPWKHNKHTQPTRSCYLM